MNSGDLQKIKKTVDNLYAEKQKLEKEQKNKKGNKGKTKVNLRIESDNVSEHKTTEKRKLFHIAIYSSIYSLQANIKEAYGNDYYESYDYDDFM